MPDVQPDAMRQVRRVEKMPDDLLQPQPIEPEKPKAERKAEHAEPAVPAAPKPERLSEPLPRPVVSEAPTSRREGSPPEADAASHAPLETRRSEINPPQGAQPKQKAAERQPETAGDERRTLKKDPDPQQEAHGQAQTAPVEPVSRTFRPFILPRSGSKPGRPKVFRGPLNYIRRQVEKTSVQPSRPVRRTEARPDLPVPEAQSQAESEAILPPPPRQTSHQAVQPVEKTSPEGVEFKLGRFPRIRRATVNRFPARPVVQRSDQRIRKPSPGNQSQRFLNYLAKSPSSAVSPISGIGKQAQQIAPPVWDLEKGQTLQRTLAPQMNAKPTAAAERLQTDQRTASISKALPAGVIAREYQPGAKPAQDITPEDEMPPVQRPKAAVSRSQMDRQPQVTRTTPKPQDKVEMPVVHAKSAETVKDVVQRAPEEGTAPAEPPWEMSQPDEVYDFGPEEPVTLELPDIAVLAKQVFPLIKRMLSLEKERSRGKLY